MCPTKEILILGMMRLTPTVSRRLLPISSLPFAPQMGVSHMWGEISPQWHLLNHLWNLGPSYLKAERLEELRILHRPNRPGEDVNNSVLPRTYMQEWRDWECTKQEFLNMGSIAGFQSFVEENEAVNRILQVVCRDEIAIGHHIQSCQGAGRTRGRQRHQKKTKGRSPSQYHGIGP